MAEWEVDVSAEGDSLPDDLLERIEAVARWTLKSEDAPDAVLSIAIVSDETISRLNEQYLSHEGPTDVISFPLDDSAGRVVGDVYVGLAQAERQADELGVPRVEELLRLVVHGTLHVLGWDHEKGVGEGEMFRRQEGVLRSFES